MTSFLRSYVERELLADLSSPVSRDLPRPASVAQGITSASSSSEQQPGSSITNKDVADSKPEGISTATVSQEIPSTQKQGEF